MKLLSQIGALLMLVIGAGDAVWGLWVGSIEEHYAEGTYYFLIGMWLLALGGLCTYNFRREVDKQDEGV